MMPLLFPPASGGICTEENLIFNMQFDGEKKLEQ
jgi:hypothetical protein